VRSMKPETYRITNASGVYRDAAGEKAMDIALFYIIACIFMGVSAFLSGLQWSEANGVFDYLKLVLLRKPFIPVVTVLIFILSGVMTQVGKHAFSLSYYEISIIWLATSWIAIAVLWIVNGIKPSTAELVGIVFCHAGLAVSTIARMAERV